ncbi:adenosylcobinamide-phosphate synthase CbiB [Devosia sp. ZB163]|uniref:adenosylcobinamide-phosphate synthase CbiB n=1 Tax=Devosia sp. ZB163 TaxID=3025938 RepID=UPI0023609A8D|nr:adenosylcobinamide-phosphate synthase CbiB [Devosia sp. ZB163]MDC9823170.1 adenosylcobinamide-phosphate synthase CbiB [Devosia sp. ZB163]
MGALVAPIALVFERLVGYPDWLVRRIGHPVMWMGALIAQLDKGLNGGAGRRGKGVAALVLLLGVTGVVSVAVAWLCRMLPFGFLVEAVLASTLIAQKSLGDAVAAVAAGLRRSLAEGRTTVSHIVGRDPQVLDEAGVARAAVESLAESSSDGVVAPLFWLVLLGLPGIALYKAANTADSMIGHKTERHLAFGWAAAKFDDLVNLVPARLTALLVAGAAFFVRGAAPAAAWATARRDAHKHDSPNAGWPEAAFAGALGYTLGGPRSYAGEVVDLPSFGAGRADLGPADIERALGLYRATLNLTLAATLVVAAMLWWLG